MACTLTFDHLQEFFPGFWIDHKLFVGRRRGRILCLWALLINNWYPVKLIRGWCVLWLWRRRLIESWKRLCKVQRNLFQHILGLLIFDVLFRYIFNLVLNHVHYLINLWNCIFQANLSDPLLYLILNLQLLNLHSLLINLGINQVKLSSDLWIAAFIHCFCFLVDLFIYKYNHLFNNGLHHLLEANWYLLIHHLLHVIRTGCWESLVVVQVHFFANSEYLIWQDA